MKIELNGTIKRISDTQTFDSGFQKREFALCIEEGEYENTIPVEAVKDKCERLDKFAPGDKVECSAFLNGNYWEKGDRYFLALRLSFIKKVEESEPAPVAAETSSEEIPF